MTSILTPLLLCLLLGAAIYVSAKTIICGFRAKLIYKQLMVSGTSADATILKVRHTGYYKSQLAQIKLELQVNRKGAQSFTAELKHIPGFEQMAQFQRGRIVQVKYNPNNLKQVVLSGASGV